MVTRTLTVWVPHWPLVAAGAPLSEPAVVVRANRVLAASPAARARGVATGMRRREAQSHCPEVEVLAHDPALDARRFETVVSSLEELTPRVEVPEPGWCSFPTRGPSRYFGGDTALAALAAGHVGIALAALAAGHVGTALAALGGAEGEAGAVPDRVTVRVGVADGAFTAELAARRARLPPATLVVAPGRSAAFLAPLAVTALDHRHTRLDDTVGLVDLFWRLGLRTLGDVAAMAEADLTARFGLDGEVAHRLASGTDAIPPDTRPVPVELTVSTELDPPVQRVDQVMFTAKTLADQLDDRLVRQGRACLAVRIEAETEHGERLARTWRHEGALRPVAVAERVRWQLDGWLHAPHRPTAGITSLRLVPEQVVAHAGRQLGFWGAETEQAERAARAVARLQGLLGPEAVTVPELQGGRSPQRQGARVRADTVVLGTRSPEAESWGGPPWPGRLPAPSPTVLHEAPVPAEVLDGAGAALTVTGRGELSAPPALVAVGRGRAQAVSGWAGPWPCDEHWWDPDRRRRRARLQVVLADGTAHVLSLEGGRWAVEATYD